MTKKPFHLAQIRDLDRQLLFAEISHSRYVEILNEIAIEWSNQKDKPEMVNCKSCDVPTDRRYLNVADICRRCWNKAEENYKR